MAGLLRRLSNIATPATGAVVVIAVIALAGSALAGRLITGAQIKNATITGADIKKNSVPPGDIKGGSGGLRGPAGATGPTGANGPTGPTGTTGASGATSYARTVIVKSGGTPVQNGTSLVNAIAGITTASAGDPWLVKLEPGTYDVGSGLAMNSHIDLQGSGPHATIISASGPSANAVFGINKTGVWISDLTLKSVGTDPSGTSDGAYLDRDWSLDNVVIDASGAGDVTGVFANGFIEKNTLTNVRISAAADGGGTATGVSHECCAPISIQDSSIIASSATGPAKGYEDNSQNMTNTITDTVIKATGGTNAWGAIVSFGDSLNTIQNSSITAIGASPANAKAVQDTSSSAGSAIRVAASAVTGGGAQQAPGVVSCIASYKGDFTTPLSSTCN